MTLETGVKELAEAVGEDVKSLKLKIGDLSKLPTQDKNNLVAAISSLTVELVTGVSGILDEFIELIPPIDDAAGLGDTDVTWSADKSSRELADTINTRIASLRENIKVTVGTGGDFPTINEALTELSKLYPLYKSDGYSCEIDLLSGFVMQEQVGVIGLDLGWITITAEDAEVVIQRSSLTKQFKGTLAYSAFYAAYNATLPTIGCLFNMDDTGIGANRHGIHISHNSKGYILKDCGIKNAGGDGVHVTVNSSLGAEEAIMTGNKGLFVNTASNVTSILSTITGVAVGAEVNDSSNAHLIGSTLKGSIALKVSNCANVSIRSGILEAQGEYAIYADGESAVTFRRGVLRGSGITGIHATYGARVDYTATPWGGSWSSNQVFLDHGSIVSAKSNGQTANISKNTVTANGIFMG